MQASNQVENTSLKGGKKGKRSGRLKVSKGAKHNYLKDIWTLIYKEKVSKNMNLTSYVLM